MPTFTPFNPSTSSPTDLTDALTQPGSGINIDPSSVSFSGGTATTVSAFVPVSGETSFSASTYDGSIDGLGIDAGILLTSGDGTPPESNNAPDYSGTFESDSGGEPDLQQVANSAFSGSGDVRDFTTLEFSFTVDNPSAQGVQFDVVFGSDEYPEFVDSSFVDVAAAFVNGDNQALFNNEPSQPLSIISENLDIGNFQDNAATASGPSSNPDVDLDLEYDGVSPRLKISAPIKAGTNTIKIGVADTGDQFLDSGVFVSNLTATNASGAGLLTEVQGTDGDDDLTGGDNNEFIGAGSGNDQISPGGGDDVIEAGAGDDTVQSGSGNKTIDPGEGNDSISSGSGNDTILSGQGSNDIVAGAGTDEVSYANYAPTDATASLTSSTGETTAGSATGITVNLANGTASGAGSSDTLVQMENATGSSGNDHVTGDGVGNELSGAAGTDTLIGANGGDAVYGNQGVDEVYGNQGVDEVYGNQGEDLVFGGLGDDLVFGGQNGDEAYGNKEADEVYGNQGDDLVFGGQGDDLVFGGQGDDQIYGNLGDDQIYGNAGTDTLVGGAGQDTFAFFGNGTDTVQDFEAGDTIGIQSNVNGTGVEAFEDLEISDEGGNAVIDLGDGASVTVEGVAPSDLTAGDFSFF
jgi:Ca2+-binding RTX toxin-like protein